MRSFWLEEALALEGPGRGLPRLEESTSADVCIVGGGYTGLWTAILLKRQDPSLDVVILERDICGAGASGRNSGFIMSWWSKFSTLKGVIGVEAALEMCRASEGAVTEIGHFCEEQGIDIDYRRDGWLWAASNPAQIGAWDKAMRDLAEHGEVPFRTVAPDEVAKLSGTPCFLAAVLEPTVATIQPAKLARGLRRVAVELGARIFERTSMTGLQRSGVPIVQAGRTSVTARKVVLAMNAWAARLPELRRKLVVISTDVLATPPIPDRLTEIGWEGGLGITDSRRLVNAYRPTIDGRLTLAKGGGALTYGGALDDRYDGPSTRTAEVLGEFRRVYPMLSGVGVDYAWKGPIDYSVSGLPYFGPLGESADVLVGVGYSGNGVGPSYLGAQMLASHLTQTTAGFSSKALSLRPRGSLPPEPFRYLGGRIVRAAIARKEVSEDRGLPPGAVTKRIAQLDPTSFIDRG